MQQAPYEKRRFGWGPSAQGGHRRTVWLSWAKALRFNSINCIKEKALTFVFSQAQEDRGSPPTFRPTANTVSTLKTEAMAMARPL